MNDATILSMQAQNALAGAKRAPNVNNAYSVEQARRVAQDFEAFFLGRMMQPMFANIEAAEPFGGGNAEEMWRSLQVDEYGKAIAKGGGVGIADAVFREILRMQENMQEGM